MKLESLGYKTFRIVDGGKGLTKAVGSENLAKSLYFDKMSKIGLPWRIFCTLIKRTDLFNIKAFDIEPFTDQIVTFLVFYDKVDILGHFVT